MNHLTSDIQNCMNHISQHRRSGRRYQRLRFLIDTCRLFQHMHWTVICIRNHMNHIAQCCEWCKKWHTVVRKASQSHFRSKSYFKSKYTFNLKTCTFGSHEKKFRMLADKTTKSMNKNKRHKNPFFYLQNRVFFSSEYQLFSIVPGHAIRIQEQNNL